MEQQTQIQLRDPSIEPSNTLIESILGKEVFGVYSEIITNLFPDSELSTNWKFYKDGKAWLCKLTYKKKTVCWLSIWEGFIKISFYFTEKTRSGIAGLAIAENIKHEIENTEVSGKLIPLIIDIRDKEQTGDLATLIAYKKSVL